MIGQLRAGLDPKLGYSKLGSRLLRLGLMLLAERCIPMTSIYNRRYQLFLGRLREARDLAGLTQRDVAKKLKRPQSFVSKCESGERKVDVVELCDFVRIYGQKANFLLPELGKR